MEERMCERNMMELRKVVRNHLLAAGFGDPQLYFERMMGDTYASYWGDGLRRIEAFYPPDTFVTAYELAFVTA